MTARTTTPSDPRLFEALARLHGHRCPMSILGARLGRAALNALGRTDGGNRLRARYHHRTCALDGIQLATCCTPGNGNLDVVPAGEHRLLLWREGQTSAAEATLTAEALERGREYSRMRQEQEALPDASPERPRLGARMEALLLALEQAPETELVCLREAEAPER